MKTQRRIKRSRSKKIKKKYLSQRKTRISKKKRRNIKKRISKKKRRNIKKGGVRMGSNISRLLPKKVEEKLWERRLERSEEPELWREIVGIYNEYPNHYYILQDAIRPPEQRRIADNDRRTRPIFEDGALNPQRVVLELPPGAQMAPGGPRFANDEASVPAPYKFKNVYKALQDHGRDH